MKDIEDMLKPYVPMYGPVTLKGLEKNMDYFWCTCGLANDSSAPWCDNTCKGTDFTPLKWTCTKSQSVYSICNCKYTKSPPFCDSEHVYLPLKYQAQIDNCSKDHGDVSILCSSCGYRKK